VDGRDGLTQSTELGSSQPHRTNTNHDKTDLDYKKCWDAFERWTLNDVDD